MDTPRLEARGLVKRFGDEAAVRGLDLSVASGELYGLVGPDGAGKTTAIRMLAGLVTPDGGAAFVDGDAVFGKGNGAVREALGYMPQRFSLYGDLSIAENLRFFGRLFGIPREERRRREERLLALTRLARFRDRRAAALSGGMYKKLALACALLHRPRVLLLDEPTNGVDPVSRRELWELLHEFVADGMAVLIATPYMDEAARCHRVGLLADGALLAEGEPAQLATALVHDTLVIRPDGGDGGGEGDGELRRADLEEALRARDDVLALSPHGAALRIVVRVDARAQFARWAAEQGLRPTPVSPDFDDVFLTLLADPGALTTHPPGAQPPLAA